MKQIKYSKKVENKILSKGWEFGYERRMTYQMMYLFYSGYYTQLNKLFGTNFSDYLFRVKNGNNSQYCLKENDIKNFEQLKIILEKGNYKFIDSLSNLIRDKFKQVNTYVADLPREYGTLSNASLIKRYKDFTRFQEIISLPIWILFSPFEHILTSVLKEKLQVEIQNEEIVSQILSTISLPTEIIPLDHYLKTLNEIVVAPASRKEKMLLKCAAKFAHLGMFDVHYKPTTLKDHQKQLKEITAGGARSFLTELKNKYSKRKQETKKVLKKFSNNTSLHSLLKFFVLYANYKEWKNFYREQFSFKARFMFIEIAKRLSLAIEEVGFMTFDEISLYIKSRKTFNREELQKRINDSAFVFLKNELCIVTAKDSLNIIDTHLLSDMSQEIKGTVAFRGLIKGEAKIVISSNDFHKINKGDILVTSTTRPDYIKIMEKAGAFVTNEGGMLSHAAILAREMKKPCVIGTKIATKVLKDGDLVEVDANTGTVTILKKA
jgi:phosphohistidine swiveling domain-containing protein